MRTYINASEDLIAYEFSEYIIFDNDIDGVVINNNETNRTLILNSTAQCIWNQLAENDNVSCMDICSYIEKYFNIIDVPKDEIQQEIDRIFETLCKEHIIIVQKCI